MPATDTIARTMLQNRIPTFAALRPLKCTFSASSSFSSSSSSSTIPAISSAFSITPRRCSGGVLGESVRSFHCGALSLSSLQKFGGKFSSHSASSSSACTLSSSFPHQLHQHSPVFSLLGGSLFLQSIRPATKVEGAAGGVQKRDSPGKHLGWKIRAGLFAKPGAIIYRQRGNQYYAGWNVEQGRDHTLWSRIYGKIVVTKLTRSFRKRRAVARFINVLAHESQREELLKDFHTRQIKLETMYTLKKDDKQRLTWRKQMEVFVKVNQTRLQRKKDEVVVSDMLKEIQAFEEDTKQISQTATGITP